MQVQIVSSSPKHQRLNPALDIQNLWFGYTPTVPVLPGINLTVAQGEHLGIVGHNGCGKTTLFLLLCGLLAPQQGQIQCLARLVKPGGFSPDIGLVFQNPDDQLFSASVWEDVAFGPQNLGLPVDLVNQRVQQALALTGLTALAHCPPHHLSGGQKRMTAIAGILAMAPQIILYDEPTANLDQRARRRLIQFLQTSTETRLIASHDLEFLLEVCSRLVLMDAGHIVATGSPREILGNPQLMADYDLEVPHSLRLALA
ncbi:energy-coupling factor ABC transporter ATP-binding protein [Synechocystis sp. LKSZ1]|uniref:energy-coupling factor ABC transporter ATP-binding protein n=1 Tax=Synechocystis sp. LKSZ1 TaxID=3144951 RepID=UPI00336BF70E